MSAGPLWECPPRCSLPVSQFYPSVASTDLMSAQVDLLPAKTYVNFCPLKK